MKSYQFLFYNYPEGDADLMDQDCIVLCLTDRGSLVDTYVGELSNGDLYCRRIPLKTIKEELATENNQLERELAELKLKIKDFCIEFDNTIWECNGDYGASCLADSLAETIQDKFGNWTC